MVVILIIGILIGISLPVFLSLRERADDRAAQVQLRTAFVVAKSYFSEGNSYSGFLADAPAMETSVEWNPTVGDPSIPGLVTVKEETENAIVLTTRS